MSLMQFSNNTKKKISKSTYTKVIDPGPDRTVGPENPRTVQIHGRFKVRNRSMRKKHGTVRTAVRPSGSVNRDRF